MGSFEGDFDLFALFCEHNGECALFSLAAKRTQAVRELMERLLLWTGRIFGCLHHVCVFGTEFAGACFFFFKNNALLIF